MRKLCRLGAEVGSSGVTELITPFADAALGLPCGGAKTGATQNSARGDRNPNWAPAKLGACSCSMAGRCVSAGRSWGKRKTKENRVEWARMEDRACIIRRRNPRGLAGGRGVIAGQARHWLAGRSGGVWPATALGGFARRVGPHPSEAGGRRWRSLGSGMWRRIDGGARPSCS